MRYLKLTIVLLILLSFACATTHKEIKIDRPQSNPRPESIRDFPEIPQKPWESCGSLLDYDLKQALLTQDEPYFMVTIIFTDDVTDEQVQTLNMMGVVVATYSGKTVTAKLSKGIFPELCQDKDIEKIKLFTRLEGMR